MLARIKYFAYRMRLLYFARKNFRKDYHDHIKYSVNYHKEEDYTKGMLRCSIMLLNHQLEKAQTYADQRDDYGKEKIQRIVRLLIKYVKRYGYDSLVYTSLGVIKAHLDNENSFKNDDIVAFFNELSSHVPDREQMNKDRGGVIKLSGEELFKDSHFLELLQSRHSCRQYADKSIERSVIEKSVTYAMTAPSACNRQCVRAHYFDDAEKIKAIVLAQKSDIQWCLKAKGLFIITGDREYFRDYFERNQRMFDAGLFSMTLCLGLHNEGIGSCFKMAQKEKSIDKETKCIAEIPESEDICVLLLVGYYPENKVVYAKSSRLNEKEILTIH